MVATVSLKIFSSPSSVGGTIGRFIRVNTRFVPLCSCPASQRNDRVSCATLGGYGKTSGRTATLPASICAMDTSATPVPQTTSPCLYFLLSPAAMPTSTNRDGEKSRRKRVVRSAALTVPAALQTPITTRSGGSPLPPPSRSEEHTSEL